MSQCPEIYALAIGVIRMNYPWPRLRRDVMDIYPCAGQSRQIRIFDMLFWRSDAFLMYVWWLILVTRVSNVMGGRLDLINQTSSPQLSPLALVTWWDWSSNLSLYIICFRWQALYQWVAIMQNVKACKSLLLLECFSFVGFEGENGWGCVIFPFQSKLCFWKSQYIVLR